jgi:hypothetical protein
VADFTGIPIMVRVQRNEVVHLDAGKISRDSIYYAFLIPHPLAVG